MMSWFRLCVLSSILLASITCEEDCFCKLNEQVDDCDCTIEAVHKFNNLYIYPRLKSLLQKAYFRFFPVNLKRKCLFWADDSKCALRDCHVKECNANELPQGLRNQPIHHKKNDYFPSGGDCAHDDENAGGLGALDTSLSDNAKEAIHNWTIHDDKQDTFCEIDDESPGDLTHVDLLKNPERFTGYAGASANRIWNVIYQENCFPDAFSTLKQPLQQDTKQCFEKRVFYRLISGLHTSISIHLCKEYLLNDFGGISDAQWGPNQEEFVRRFHPHHEPEGPQRLKHLYFTYLVELRALVKAAPFLLQETYFTGDAQADADTKEAVASLLEAAKHFEHHFDESRLFRDENLEEVKNLKTAFRSHFRNISRIMDCVGCDKCKLWGKLQVTGMGTALKILFSGHEFGPHSTVPKIEEDSGHKFLLKRVEIVTLFNAIGRLSQSIFSVDTFRDLLKQKTDL